MALVCLHTVPIYIYIHKGRNLVSVVVYLTCPEIGKSVVSMVNNDVTLGLTTVPDRSNTQQQRGGSYLCVYDSKHTSATSTQ